MIVPRSVGIPWPEREATRRSCGKTGTRAVAKVAHTPGQGLRAQTPRPLAVEVVIDDAGHFADRGCNGPVGLLAFHDASFSLVNAGSRCDDHYVQKHTCPGGGRMWQFAQMRCFRTAHLCVLSLFLPRAMEIQGSGAWTRGVRLSLRIGRCTARYRRSKWQRTCSLRLP